MGEILNRLEALAIIDSLLGGLRIAGRAIADGEVAIARDLSEYNRRRAKIMHAHVLRLLPDLSKDTWVSLGAEPLTKGQFQIDHRLVFERAWKLAPTHTVSAFAFWRHERSMAMVEPYTKYVTEHLPTLHERLLEHLERFVPSHDELSHVAKIDAEVRMLRKRRTVAAKMLADIESKYSVLGKLADIAQTTAVPEFVLHPLVGNMERMETMKLALRTVEGQECPDKPVSAWLNWMPESLYSLGVRICAREEL